MLFRSRLVGEDRSIVHDMPGTTRDAIDTRVEWPDGPITFIDTAGMRRRSRVDESTEQSSVVRSLRAVDEADIAILVVDASEGVTAQDQRLAERVDAAGCPVVVCLNKWDLLDDDAKQVLEAEVTRRLARVPADYCPSFKLIWPLAAARLAAGEGPEAG